MHTLSTSSMAIQQEIQYTAMESCKRKAEAVVNSALHSNGTNGTSPIPTQQAVVNSTLHSKSTNGTPPMPTQQLPFEKVLLMTKGEGKEKVAVNLALHSNHSNGTNGTSSMPTQQLRPLEKVLSMTKGKGHDSYSKNSGFQAFMYGRVLPDLDRALEQATLPAHGPVVVAEMGCSSGPNAAESVDHVIRKLRAVLSRRDPACPPAEFQAFFNDLPSNDFNNLFQILGDRGSGCGEDYFAAGVPGSFYGRVFVRSSVHVMYSGLASHWLSKVPDAVQDKGSPAFNKGRTWIFGSTPPTTTAFKEQALSDLKNFLNVRAAELVPGGLLVFTGIGRPSACTDPSRPWEICPVSEGVWIALEEAWNDLISEGILTEEQRDSFNIPWYARSVEDVLAAVEGCDSEFHLQTAEVYTADVGYDRIFSTPEPFQQMERLGGTLKSLFVGLVEAHLGKEVSKVYWQHYELNLKKHVLPKMQLEKACKFGILFVALTRK